MAKLEPNELRPGLSVYQNIVCLRSCEGCEINMHPSLIPNRNGPFLLIERHDENRWLCVPLYTEKENKDDRILIDPSKKSGFESWLQRESFYSVKQFWIIPDDCLIGASDGPEFRKVGKRNTFAENDADALADIASHKAGGGATFTPISN